MTSALAFQCRGLDTPGQQQGRLDGAGVELHGAAGRAPSLDVPRALPRAAAAVWRGVEDPRERRARRALSKGARPCPKRKELQKFSTA